MAKTKISEFDSTPANNSDINGINIAEGMAPSNVNNALRQMMANLKDMNIGSTITMLNDTEEDGEGGRANKIIFKGEQSGGEESVLGEIQASHDGTADDQKGDLIFRTNDGSDGTSPTERLRIDSAGNVGIAESSPLSRLTISKESSRTNDTENMIRINHSTSGTSAVGFGSKIAFIGERSNGAAQAQGNIGFVADVNTSSNLSSAFVVDTAAAGVSSERMRVDSSGNVLVGKDTIATATAGIALRSNGEVRGTVSGAEAARFSRLSSDGAIVGFEKDGAAVGSIGIESSGFVVDGEASHAGLKMFQSAIGPRQNGSDIDDTVDIGHSGGRFDNIFATNGTIQTSDENEKQNIASLTSAEITAATAISKLFKTYKWKDAVSSKGDAARTHAGVIAQQVQTAMSDAGLDASKYGFGCSDTWWETQTEVAAVEAQDAVYEDVVIPAIEEVLDDDGNVVTEAQPERTEQRLVSEAVEAKDAYTRTDTFDTKDEAPEGATERTRLGVRYPELLAFIGAATEQRLTSIEARLDALEG